MKLLMIYATRFGYTTSLKALDDAVERSVTTALADVLVGLIHVEAADESDPAYAETKLVKNLKWAARKNDSNRILLHSFAHLAESKASPDMTRTLLNNAERRLVEAGYETEQTPFGYFLDLHIQAPGTPLARLFKDIQPPNQGE